LLEATIVARLQSHEAFHDDQKLKRIIRIIVFLAIMKDCTIQNNSAA